MTKVDRQHMIEAAGNWHVTVTFCVEHLGWARPDVTPERITEALMQMRPTAGRSVYETRPLRVYWTDEMVQDAGSGPRYDAPAGDDAGLPQDDEAGE